MFFTLKVLFFHGSGREKVSFTFSIFISYIVWCSDSYSNAERRRFTLRNARVFAIHKRP